MIKKKLGPLSTKIIIHFQIRQLFHFLCESILSVFLY